MPFRVVSRLLYSTVCLTCRLERGKQPGRNDLIPIFALHSADIWSAGPVEAGDYVLTSLHAWRKTPQAVKYEGYFDFKQL